MSMSTSICQSQSLDDGKLVSFLLKYYMEPCRVCRRHAKNVNNSTEILLTIKISVKVFDICMLTLGMAMRQIFTCACRRIHMAIPS